VNFPHPFESAVGFQATQEGGVNLVDRQGNTLSKVPLHTAWVVTSRVAEVGYGYGDDYGYGYDDGSGDGYGDAYGNGSGSGHGCGIIGQKDGSYRLF
jgi:hypothetical protein